MKKFFGIMVIVVVALLLVFAVSSASAEDKYITFEGTWWSPLTSEGALNAAPYTIKRGDLWRATVAGVKDLKGSNVGYKNLVYSQCGTRFSYEDGGFALTGVAVQGKILEGYDFEEVVSATDEPFGKKGGNICRIFDRKVVSRSKLIAQFTADGFMVQIWEYAPKTETQEAVMGYVLSGAKTIKSTKGSSGTSSSSSSTEEKKEEKTEDTNWTIGETNKNQEQNQNQDQNQNQSHDWDIGGDNTTENTDWTIGRDSGSSNSTNASGWNIGGGNTDSSSSDSHSGSVSVQWDIGNGKTDGNSGSQETGTGFSIGNGNGSSSEEDTDFSI